MGSSCSAEDVGERPYMEPTVAPAKIPVTKVLPRTPQAENTPNSAEEQAVVHRVVSEAFEHVVTHQADEDQR